MNKNVFRNLGYGIGQYWQIFTIVLFLCVSCVLCIISKDGILEFFIFSLMGTMIVVVGMVIYYNLLCIPKGCKILHLFKQEISMKPKKVKNKKDFYNDLDVIIRYAKKKNVNELFIKTHLGIIGPLLKHYINKDYKRLFNKCNELQVGSSMTVEVVPIGELKITRIEDCINSCARYEYNNRLTWKQFVKTITPVKKYHITINLV